MREPLNTPRDIARELARKYSTMTHDELDVLESILVPMKFGKNEMILKEGEVCENIYYIDRGVIRQFYFKKRQGSYRTFRFRPLYLHVHREPVS